MYDKERNITDRREMLRVKLKSLAAEAKIIRREESRTWGPLLNELHQHRIGVVRSAARETHIAYGFVRGLHIDRMEPSRKTEPNWAAIRQMLKRYGQTGLNEASLWDKYRPLGLPDINPAPALKRAA